MWLYCHIPLWAAHLACSSLCLFLISDSLPRGKPPIDFLRTFANKLKPHIFSRCAPVNKFTITSKYFELCVRPPVPCSRYQRSLLSPCKSGNPGSLRRREKGVFLDGSLYCDWPGHFIGTWNLGVLVGVSGAAKLHLPPSEAQIPSDLSFSPSIRGVQLWEKFNRHGSSLTARFPLVPLKPPIPASTQGFAYITHKTKPVQLITSANHWETITLFMFPSLIVGFPWLKNQNSHLDWTASKYLTGF